MKIICILISKVSKNSNSNYVDLFENGCSQPVLRDFLTQSIKSPGHSPCQTPQITIIGQKTFLLLDLR